MISLLLLVPTLHCPPFWHGLPAQTSTSAAVSLPTISPRFGFPRSISAMMGTTCKTHASNQANKHASKWIHKQAKSKRCKHRGGRWKRKNKWQLQMSKISYNKYVQINMNNGCIMRKLKTILFLLRCLYLWENATNLPCVFLLINLVNVVNLLDKMCTYALCTMYCVYGNMQCCLQKSLNPVKFS